MTLRQRYAAHRYRVLFATLLVSLVVLPITRPLGFAEFFLGANLLAGVVALSEGAARGAALTVLLVAVAARVAGAWLDQSAVADGSLAVWGIVALVAAAQALRFALRGREISTEQVCAALSAYLLGGLFFGVLFWVIDAFAPQSLVVGGTVETASITLNTAIYFSFVTLASLGYGDVLPVSDPARGLAVIEVVGGQLYLAVMVARLVGAWR